MVRKYVRIQEEVEAIQANDNNLDELREFAGDVRKVNPNNGGDAVLYRAGSEYRVMERKLANKKAKRKIGG